jgi:nucleoside-diphosphate-sugar epimerase
MSLLLTGSTGFVGKNILTNLKNLDFISLSREQLTNIASYSIGDFDAILHLAGKAHDLKKATNPHEYYQTNFELTKNLYDAFIKSNATKFIFVSSVKAAADSVEGILTENHIPNPQTHYGKSKLMAEEYIQAQILPEGKSYYILRPCMIHGPGNKGNLNLLYKFVEKGIPYPLAAFENKRSFLSVQNLCFIVQKLLEKNIPSGIYNLADDETLSTKDLVKQIAQILDKKPKLWHISKKAIGVLALIGDKLHLPLNTERLHKLTENYVVSNAKIKTAINETLPLTSSEGIKITIQTFKNT